jgi:hypothetical protein
MKTSHIWFGSLFERMAHGLHFSSLSPSLQWEIIGSYCTYTYRNNLNYFHPNPTPTPNLRCPGNILSIDLLKGRFLSHWLCILEISKATPREKITLPGKLQGGGGLFRWHICVGSLVHSPAPILLPLLYMFFFKLPSTCCHFSSSPLWL